MKRFRVFGYLLVFLLGITVLFSPVATCEEEEILFEQPAIITSIGQSPCARILSSLANAVGVENTFHQMAFVEDITEGYKTLIVVLGGSAKGLGDAGLRAGEELERGQDIVAAAKELGMKVIAVHSGGSTRRGDLTDRFIEGVVPQVHYVLVREGGNEDQVFSNIAQEKNIPFVEVADVSKLREHIGIIFADDSNE